MSYKAIFTIVAAYD
jgi:hypothetical protein